VKYRSRFVIALALAVPLVGGSPARADKKPDKEILSFATLKPATVEEARGQALAWLKGVGKTDAAAMQAFEAIWSQPDRTLLDRVADSLALGDETAAKLLADANNSFEPAPLAAPPALKDAKQPVFYRANLAVAYARALGKRRVYEEALDTLKTVRPEQVVDPATYLFHRAVAEHAMLQKDEATRTILRLIDETVDTPERYKLVGSLMYLDMQSWRDKDLGWIARKMDNIERRLDLSRGGPQTQNIQKEVILRLDELIKQMENQAKGSSQANGGACPNGGQQNQQGQQRAQGQPNNPMRDSRFGDNSGPGKVDPKKLEGIAKAWGKLPEKERAKAMQELIRDMPPEYRELIETYFRKLAQAETGRP
jgi:hypothetical protein